MEARPVAGLAAGGDEFMRVKDHDLILVGLVHQYTVHRRRVCSYDGETFAHHSEHALHSS